MAISITEIQSPNNCDHITVTVNDEGNSRTFTTSYTEVDNMFPNLSILEQKRLLVILWARYRRATGRTVLNVNIA